MAKKISFGLSVAEVNKAIQEIKTYQNDLNRKCELLCQKLCQEGIQIAKAHIGSSGFGKYIHLGSEITQQQAGVRRRIEIGANCILNSRLLPTRLCSHTGNCTVQGGKTATSCSFVSRRELLFLKQGHEISLTAFCTLKVKT